MPSRVKNLTGDAVERRTKSGHGRGEGNDYKPWLRTTDISSRGTSVQWCSSKLERANHTLSQGEYRYLLLLKYSPSILDIREQFPLEVSETQAIARALGVRHPLIRGKVMVMTTDFLLTVKVGKDTIQVARTCKEKGDLKGERLFQKLEIERQYWEMRGVDWGLVVTDADIPEEIWRNIEWFLDCRRLEKLEPMTTAEVQSVALWLISEVRRAKIVTLSLLGIACDEVLDQPPGTGLKVARFLFANRVFLADIATRIWPDNPVSITVSPENLPRMLDGDDSSHN
jgi:hypothetical protein